MRRFLTRALLVFFAAASARAQSVHWAPSDSGDPAEVQLVFQDCQPSSDRPDLPSIPDTTFTLEGTSSQTNIINFSVSRSTIFTYGVRSSHPGPVSIPAFTVDTNKGVLRVPAFTGGANTRSAAPIDIKSIIEPARTTVWAGEVFPLTYTLDVGRRILSQVGATIDWDSTPLVIEDWSKLEQRDAFVNGEPRINIISRTRGYAKTPGPVTLKAATQAVSVQSGSVGFGLFQMPRVEQLTVTSNTPSLAVRALPPAPAGFSGAVGQFKLTSKVVPTTAAVGEPVTWTLELTGTGNWPDIAGLPQREVSKDFNVVQPQAKRTPVDGKLFDQHLTEDVVLVPTRAGPYTLDPVAFVYFDPRSGGYKTITTPAATITITPAASTPAAPPVAASSPPGESPDEKAATPPSFDQSEIGNLKSKIPTFPSGIPRDPLTGSAPAIVPLTSRTLILWLLVPGFSLLVFWLFLAVRRAHRTDPLRPQREARARLIQLLTQLKRSPPSLAAPKPGAGGSPFASRLLSWQHDTAVLFQVSHAAPPAAALSRVYVGGLPRGAPRRTGSGGSPPTALPAEALAQARAVTKAGVHADPESSAWIQLWLEADRAIYGPSPDLPSDWTARAEAALTAKKLPGFSPLRLFLPQNLLPFVAALILLLFPFFLLPNSVRAADSSSVASAKGDEAGTDNPLPFTHQQNGEAAYKSGDFSAAEKAWSSAVATHPADAVARYNLSLALAQQDRWPEAAAQAAAAFVQHPSLAPVAWQLAISCENAGYVPAPLAGFLPPGPTESLARFLAPGAWQIALILAAFLAALGLALLLIDVYSRTSRLRRIAALVVVCLGFLLAAAAVISLHVYGDTARREAVIAWRSGILRSIPTEADTTQKTTPLAAGTVALGDKTLLGWIRLRFPNGQTGWVRKEEVIALWR